jgi:hypothetical protein
MDDAEVDKQNGSLFETVVAVRIDGHWHFVESAEQALRCLNESFPGTHGASHARALATYALFRGGQVPVRSLQAAFVVAAMAAGYPFEILQRDEMLLERMVSAAAEEALLEALPSPQ